MKLTIIAILALLPLAGNARPARSEYNKFMENFRPSPEQIAAEKCRRAGGVWNSAFDCLSRGWASGETVVDEEQCNGGRAYWVSGEGLRCL